MRRMHRVAHQHDVAAAVEMAPFAADQTVEVEPGRAAQMAGIAHQARAIEDFTEKFLAEGDRARFVGRIEAVRLEHILGRLDDKGRGVFVEFVDMGLEPAVFGAAKIEGESVVGLLGPEPDEAVRPHQNVRLELLLVSVANLRVDAVGSDDQVGVGEFEVGVDLALEHELHPELFAAFLQNVEQFLAADADKAVAGGAHTPVFDPDLDVVPMVERGLDRLRGLAVPSAHILHGRIGENDAPAEGVVRLVPLNDRNVMGRVFLLHQQAEIEPSRAASDANDAHMFLRPSPPNSTRRKWFRLQISITHPPRLPYIVRGLAGRFDLAQNCPGTRRSASIFERFSTCIRARSQEHAVLPYVAGARQAGARHSRQFHESPLPGDRRHHRRSQRSGRRNRRRVGP